jgi:Flp pilus assembly pilin Flp
LANFFTKRVASLRRLLTDENGHVLVEVTLIAVLIIFLVLGSVDFLFAFYRWNAAGKAVQVGARIAAVSDPVATGLNDLSVDVGGNLRDPMPSFTVTCPGNASTCTCTGECTGTGNSPVLDQNALNKIVYGRGSNPGNPQCGTGGGIYFAGMCSMYPGLTPANVVIVYTHTQPGLGYIGRITPVPTVQVSLQDSGPDAVNFRFYFLPFGPIQVRPSSTIPTTVTGEVLSSVAQCSWGPC